MLLYVTHPRSEILTALAVKISLLNYGIWRIVVWYELTDVSDIISNTLHDAISHKTIIIISINIIAIINTVNYKEYLNLIGTLKPCIVRCKIPYFDLALLMGKLHSHIRSVTIKGKSNIYEACSKKNPNFLNTAPTGTEGALRLLSAPSGGFWQQAAICGANDSLLSKPAARCAQ
jgi:hypothetical protein